MGSAVSRTISILLYPVRAYLAFGGRLNSPDHVYDWKCWFRGMVYPGIHRVLFVSLSVAVGYFLFSRQPLQAAISFALVMTSIRVISWHERDLEIRKLPVLWAWIEKHHPKIYRWLPEEPPLRPWMSKIPKEIPCGPTYVGGRLAIYSQVLYCTYYTCGSLDEEIDTADRNSSRSLAQPSTTTAVAKPSRATKPPS